jgi:formylglycine-generating enzyme required for sulfatase activity
VRALLLASLAAGGSSLGCGNEAEQLPPVGQILLYVTTDAPLPSAPGAPADANAPPALFDRLLLEVHAPGESERCRGCFREIELYRERISDGKGVSMGIVPTPGEAGYVARARLFRAITKQDNQPPELSTIDVFAALPVVNGEGVVNATIELRVDDLGQAREPIAALPGKPDSSKLAVWSPARRVSCSGAVAPSEACVPGGAFWMGHPSSGLHGPGGDATVSRLVVLRPFFVDLHEVTVAEYRSSRLARIENGTSVDPLAGPSDASATELTPLDEQFYCTYSDAPLNGEHSRESLPVNCISWSAASAYCAAQGKSLPSEAEWEYLASGLRSNLFVWGSDVDSLSCSDGTWERAGAYVLLGGHGACFEGERGGPLPPGSGKLDRLILGDREVVDLMANVNEWTRDLWNRDTEPCWSGRALLDNPECTAPSTVDPGEPDPLHTVKGSSWIGAVLPAASRRGAGGALPSRGFRCVRTDP